MSKTSTRTKSVKSHWGRARQADASSEPFHVSDAQTKTLDKNTSRKFDFSQRGQGGLLERPRTAGGAVSKSSMRKAAEKQETKDDLHFNPLAVHGKGTVFYDFPRPGKSHPSQVSPSKLSPPPKPKKPTSDIPESILDAHPEVTMNIYQQQPVDSAIGMALGSPAHPPSGWKPQPNAWQPQSHNNLTPRTLSPEQDMAMDGPVSVTKPKGSRWKMLGGLFGAGRKNSEPQPFYQLQPEPAHQVTIEADTGDSVESSTEKRPRARGRTLTTSEHMTEKKPDIIRSHTLPVNVKHNATKMSRAPEIIINSSHDFHHAGTSHNYKSQGLLDVDIPTIQMERYSIMFGSVLQKTPITTGSSSLLARRQATLDKLKTVNEALASKERELEARAQLLRPRRATSPQPTKSPAFSLFPSTPSRPMVHDALPSSLQRSNTSPAALSPSRPSFSNNLEDNEISASLSGPAPHIPHAAPRPKISASFRKKPDLKALPNSALGAEPSKIDPPEVKSKHQKQINSISQETSHLDFGSDDDDDDEDEDIYRVPLKPKLDEPTWQMVASVNSGYGTTTSISGGSSVSRSDGHSTSTSASSIMLSPPNTSTSVSVKTQVEIQAVPAARRKRAATTSSATRSVPRPVELTNAAFGASSAIVNISTLPKPTLRSTFNTSSTTANPSTSPKEVINDGEREERLKSAADLSIARQISVSRQQTQLLIPITKLNSTAPKPKSQIPIKKSISAATTPSTQRSHSNPNFPTPVPMNMARSPLQIVSDPESPITGTPFARPRMVTVKPSTPTLVVTGNDAEQYEKSWGGQTALNDPSFMGNEYGGGHIGLQARSPIGNRKSERVILERVH